MRVRLPEVVFGTEVDVCGLSTISGELVERYTPAVRAAALSEVRDPELVDDIVQDTAYCARHGIKTPYARRRGGAVIATMG